MDDTTTLPGPDRLPGAAAATAGAPLAGLLGPCIRSALAMLLITGVAYPLATTGAAQLLFPHQANGSLLRAGTAVVGSALIGQQFDAPRYFQPRPSATQAPDPQDAAKSVAAPYNAAASGASNQGPANPALAASVQERVAAYRQANGLAADAAVPVDAVTASASGLDPHISPANALVQAQRVARARALEPARVLALVQDHTEPRLAGLLGEPRVNVLRLNLALDAAAAGKE